MAETPEKNSDVEEEPQEERGPKGSRDTGSDRPSAALPTVPRAPRTNAPTPPYTRRRLRTRHRPTSGPGRLSRR